MALSKRHSGEIRRSVLHVGDISLDTRTLTVERNRRCIKLTPKSLHILKLLMMNPNKVFGHAELETAVWGEPQADSDTLRTHIYALRRALTANGEDDPIETVHCQGYRLVESHGP